MKKHIHHFVKNYSTCADRVFFLLTIIAIIIGLIIETINAVHFHYPTILLFATHISFSMWVEAILFTLMCTTFLIYALYIRKESTRSSTFLWGIGVLTWAGIANIVIVNSIQSTPFPPIDFSLLAIDRYAGIHTTDMLRWIHNHPTIFNILNQIYFSMIIELIGIPVALTIFGARKPLTVFYIALMVGTIIGCLIYYFFPTMAPSGIVHSPYFSIEQQDTSIRFFDVHHFIKPTTSQGGLIAFPSFHVFWAVLLTYVCRQQRLIFYPLAVYNAILILSTVVLGWHYVTDVVGGIALAAVSIYYAEKIYAKD